MISVAGILLIGALLYLVSLPDRDMSRSTKRAVRISMLGIIGAIVVGALLP
jgi:hypothetical protein